jgi:hypothetical protein
MLNPFRSQKKLKSLALFTLILTVGVGQAFASDDIDKRAKAAKHASQTLVKELGGVLKKQIREAGPAEAIKVCRELAPSITGRISNANGWRMTRVSHRYRNALLGMPDEWEKAVLKKFQQRKQKGEDFKTMAYYEVVAEASGDRYFRFMKALPTKEVCLTCHGSKDSIPESVQAKLNTLFPLDQATEFNKGDLRGAISIKQPMNIPLVTDGIGWE